MRLARLLVVASLLSVSLCETHLSTEELVEGSANRAALADLFEEAAISSVEVEDDSIPPSQSQPHFQIITYETTESDAETGNPNAVSCVDCSVSNSVGFTSQADEMVF
eukprot:TRINITY_DN2533_c0_g1_i1.p1 TRINITY_DN2533_c0_g1~~TRINITY_DN2533_c0_g1_i1.p1  ORF type:complete len:108 (+),score=26.36 TRINITY_DN2533_c0_g1_i1:55-378(+)